MRRNFDNIPTWPRPDRPASARAHAKHLESRLQRDCVAWFRLQYPKHALMLFAVPNGGGRSRVEASIMKAEGVTAGVADLILLEARGGFGSLCIEMKTSSSSSRQSVKQKEWQRQAEANGNRYVVCRTLEQFRATVGEYMRQPPSLHHRVSITPDDLAPAKRTQTVTIGHEWPDTDR